MSTTPQGLFRQEAVEHYNRGEIQGNLLQLTPFWVRTTYWVVVALALSLGLTLAVVRIHEYAQGPLLIQVQGVEDITATAGGRVTRILVGRGQQVRAGDPLVELHARGETAERDRVEQEFRTQLAARLTDPLNASARQALGSLRAQMDLSEVLVSERTLVAPFDGWVREVRVRENQYLETGEVVVTLSRQETGVTALILVPGQYRPMLEPGQRLRVELSGFAYLYQDVTVSSVSDELLGPTEVRRFLGPGHGDLVTLEGPMVAVEARMPDEGFRAQGHHYRYYNGMVGTGRVQVRERNGWTVLIPALDALWGNRD
ncbi:HlyD family efflux transporter periplasmic adaptor subunit [Myxococcus stipitatus]|uniref:HlyD family efflux transporter periplasmic adaptor subunit n=1 Tax=Myxococcus stipitatus TaxID=83455 RepID=UPI0030D3ED03